MSHDPGRRPAVFLDRDGTVIEHVHYLADPARVRLLAAAPGALRSLREAGYALVVVTNQSAIGRGMVAVEQYLAVDAEMRRQLRAEGVELDGVYYCPDVPGVDDPTVVAHGDRKPGPGMLLRGARELGLDLARSWMVGDVISDVLAGAHAGCLGSFLVRTGKPLADEAPAGVSYRVADDLAAVASAILSPGGPAAHQKGPNP